MIPARALQALLLITSTIVTGVGFAAAAPFDLAGPSLAVTVTRGARTLPIAEVPNFEAGDLLSIRPLLPEDQSVHYLMVAAFLRGPTNPPPENWFFLCKTWTKGCAQDGLRLTIPADAQQVVVFLAPQTGGDYKTLRSAVRGRPGAFVRASQELNQAALDRARLEVYLSSLRTLDRSDQARLREVAPLLARSLAIKVDEKCLDRVPGLQAPCLMQGQDTLILNDGHSASIVEALTSGPATDLAMEASRTPQFDYGYYSPYLASIFDIGRLLDSLHTAQFQYIPALATYRGDRVALTLNTPPSFHEPRSVLVAALPAVEPPRPPPLHPVNPGDVFCASKDALVLPVAGAPLAFAARYAHDLVLRLRDPDGNSIDLAASADAEQGGIVVDTSGMSRQLRSTSYQGSLHGFWGFDAYDGPRFSLVGAQSRPWELATADGGPLIVGHESIVSLHAGSASCVRNVGVSDSTGRELPVAWRAQQADQIEVKLPLQAAAPGKLTFAITQYGLSEPQRLTLQSFPDAGKLDSFTLHAGDSQGTLVGSRLDQVTALRIKGFDFAPGLLERSHFGEELTLTARAGQTPPVLTAGEALIARVSLQDGRTLSLNVIVSGPRPAATLIDKIAQTSAADGILPIRLGDPDELPLGASLTFSVRTDTPILLARDAAIEIASAGDEPVARLTPGNGTLMLQNRRVAVAKLDTTSAFGPTAFGPLRFRVVADGAVGDWLPLVTLVRLPLLSGVQCPTPADAKCTLSGSRLFLLESVSKSPEFDDAVQVPDGFTGAALAVPHLDDGRLFVRLRDNPGIVSEVDFPPKDQPGLASSED